MKPGEYILRGEPIICNEGAETRIMNVTNRGDRPVQVGSHYHFAEVNPALDMDRVAARGFRLDIPAGTAVRFEPGDARSVHLVEIAGNREVYGFRNHMNGSLGASVPPAYTEAIGGTAGINAEAEPELAACYSAKAGWSQPAHRLRSWSRNTLSRCTRSWSAVSQSTTASNWCSAPSL